MSLKIYLSLSVDFATRYISQAYTVSWFDDHWPEYEPSQCDLIFGFGVIAGAPRFHGVFSNCHSLLLDVERSLDICLLNENSYKSP